MLQDSLFIITIYFVKVCNVRLFNVGQHMRKVPGREDAGGVTAQVFKKLNWKRALSC